MPMEFRIHAASDPGCCHQLNEDSLDYRLLPAGGLVAVVADGVGGKPGGAFASRMAVEEIIGAMVKGDAEPAAEQLRAACLRANAAVRRGRETHPGYEDMATTVVALVARDGEAALLHAGDSRCYRWHAGALSCLTRDDTVAEQMVDDGTIAAADVAHTPYQHLLTRALGIRDEFAHTLCTTAIAGDDAFLLCSDGLNKTLSDAAIAAVLTESADDVAALTSLVAAANAAGGPDNISIILIRCIEIDQ